MPPRPPAPPLPYLTPEPPMPALPLMPRAAARAAVLSPGRAAARPASPPKTAVGAGPCTRHTNHDSQQCASRLGLPLCRRYPSAPHAWLEAHGRRAYGASGEQASSDRPLRIASALLPIGANATGTMMRDTLVRRRPQNPRRGSIHHDGHFNIHNDTAVARGESAWTEWTVSE